MAVVHLSPELPRLSVRGHKREPSDPVEFLSASYSAVQHLEDDDGPGVLQRSYSGRPRSRSTSHTLALGSNGKLRKSLRGLGLSRPSGGTGWIGSKAKQGGGGGDGTRRASASDAEDSSTLQIDSAFARIREQLAKLAEEDQVLRERVEKLNEEINSLNSSCTVVRRSRAGSHGQITPGWRASSHFSGSFNGGESFSRARRSIPVISVSSSSQDRLRGLELLQEVDSVHETIDEQTDATSKSEMNCVAVHESRDKPPHIKRIRDIADVNTDSVKQNSSTASSGSATTPVLSKMLTLSKPPHPEGISKQRNSLATTQPNGPGDTVYDS